MLMKNKLPSSMLRRLLSMIIIALLFSGISLLMMWLKVDPQIGAMLIFVIFFVCIFLLVRYQPKKKKKGKK